jgi:aldose 1-epimerase
MATPRVTVRRAPFGHLADGSPVEAFTLRNASQVELRAITYGCTIVELWAPDRAGVPGDIVLGYDTVAAYASSQAYLGAVIGRYANRIAQGRFTLDGTAYQLPVNNGPHHLHGGRQGFNRRIWRAEPYERGEETGVRFNYTSPDGEEGYPGTLVAEVRYALTPDNEVVVDYYASSDRPTIVNLTQHSYFNLGGTGAGDVLGHELTLEADGYLPIDRTCLPRGEIAPVADTVFDFRVPAVIGARIDDGDPQLRHGHGYDHTFVLRRAGAGLERAARLSDPGTGRVLEVSTTEPGLQVYTANFLEDPVSGKPGHPYGPRSGVTLETQHFPDSPNHAGFPSTSLRPGEAFRSRTVFALRVMP